MSPHLLILDKPTRHPAALPAELSPAQLEAGNYAKRKVTFQGLTIAIENPTGTLRRGIGPGGVPWETSMRFDYGYILGTLGVDGDHFDCYLGLDKTAPMAYLITTKKPPGFTVDDEQKVMLGFASADAAREALLLHFDDSRFAGALVEMPIAEFRAKVLTTRAHPRLLKCLLLVRPGL